MFSARKLDKAAMNLMRSEQRKLQQNIGGSVGSKDASSVDLSSSSSFQL
jgi:hypothetical protein